MGPVTKNIVAHDCEKGGGICPVQRLKLDPGPEQWTFHHKQYYFEVAGGNIFKYENNLF